MSKKPPSRVELLRRTLDLLIRARSCRAESWPRHREAHSAHLRRSAVRSKPLVVSGTLSPGSQRLDHRVPSKLSDKGSAPVLRISTRSDAKQLLSEGPSRMPSPARWGSLLKPLDGARDDSLGGSCHGGAYRRRREAELREDWSSHRRGSGGHVVPTVFRRSGERRLPARMGNVTLLREDAGARSGAGCSSAVRAGRSIRPARDAQESDVHRAGGALAGARDRRANTAIYSFMDADLLRSLPVLDRHRCR